MFIKNHILCLFFILFGVYVVSSEYSYTAAVVDYNAANYTSPSKTMEENLKNYLNFIKEAADNKADIIVFPEYGLTGLLWYPEKYAINIPAVGKSDFPKHFILEKLSASAKKHKIYVVVNLLESAVDKSSRTIYYNTNVVFSKNGSVVAKYRKIGLFYEPGITKGEKSITFDTEFGKFGLITCMDILYYKPSQEIFARSSGVTNVIFSTAWNSVLPFYMSIGVQLGYAKANNINLLASNYAIPSVARGGSGIYSKEGTILNMHISGLNTSKLILSKVGQNQPSENTVVTQNMTTYSTLRDFNSSVYAYKHIDLSKGLVTDKLCYENFCCNFEIVANQEDVVSSEIYKLAVYNGSTFFETTPVNMKFCIIISCKSNDTSTCGVQKIYSTKFQKISINGIFENRPESFYRPVTLKGDLIPFLNTKFQETIIGTNTEVTICSEEEKTKENLLIFGIYGRSDHTQFKEKLHILHTAGHLRKLKDDL